MKNFLVTGALIVSTAALAACGDGDPTTARDTGASSSAASAVPSTVSSGVPSGAPAEVPTAVPAASGPVRSRDLPTVMDTGTGPVLCLGAIAESYPPQCTGPAVVGWRWKDRAPAFERQGDVRWGTFAVTGTWDGTAFTVTDAVPGALHDPAPVPPVDLPEPTRDLDDAELEALAAELTDVLPGVQSATPDGQGHVLVDVVYDDGSLQRYADAAHGAGVVVVTGALVDA